MTNYYTHISFEVKLNPKAVAWLETYMDLWVENDVNYWKRRDFTNNNPRLAPYEMLGCEFEINKSHTLALWVSGYNVDLDDLAKVLQAMLIACEPVEYIAFEYAFTADRPVLDAFGGGACWVTKDDVEFFSTGEWIRKRGIA
jgi:hypothetical protein